MSAKLFPLLGVTLGSTTLEQLKGMGKVDPKYDLVEIGGVNFWHANGRADHLYLTNTDPMPEAWRKLGMNWEICFDDWLKVLGELSYDCKITKGPGISSWAHGPDYFDAEVEATGTREPIQFVLGFRYNRELGKTRQSPKTLYSMSVNYVPGASGSAAAAQPAAPPPPAAVPTTSPAPAAVIAPPPNCPELLELATPVLYRRNLFRVLDLPVNAQSIDVRRRQKRLEMQRKLGLNDAAADKGVLALTPLPSDEETRAAMERLNDPKNRLLDELFWFWPTSANDTALAMLNAGKADEATSAWMTQALLAIKGLPAHNLAVLAHLRALDDAWAALQAGKDHVSPQSKEWWDQAFAFWRQVCESDTCWNHLRQRAREINDAAVTTGLIARLRQTLPTALMMINARLACAAAAKGLGKLAAEQIRIMGAAGFEGLLVDTILRDALGPVRQKIKAAIEAARKRWAEDTVHGDKHVRDMQSQCAELLKIVDGVLPADDSVRIGLHDMVAEAMLDGQIAWSRKTDDWAGGIKLLELAQTVAAGDINRSRLDEHIATLRKNIELGNDWCSPGYWDLPADVIEQLEDVREKSRGGEHQSAIQTIAAMDPALGKPVWRCLAFALSQRGSQIAARALNEFNEPSSVLKKFIEVIGQKGTIRVPTPETPSYSLPECPCCGSTYYSRWVNGEYRGQKFWFCSSCSSNDDAEREGRKPKLRAALTEALEHLLLASEIDPKDVGIKDSLKTCKEVAVKFMVSLPRTKAIRQRLGEFNRRGRRLEFTAQPTCHFCGKGEADEKSAIEAPLCGPEQPCQTLFGKGNEYRYAGVQVPRCRSCRQEHARLPQRLSDWQRGREAAGAPGRFPDLAAALKSAESALEAAQTQRANADKPETFGGLYSALQQAQKQASEALARREAQKAAVAAAEGELAEAQKLGHKCDHCGHKSWWRNHLCVKCDPDAFRLGRLPKLAAAAWAVFAGIAGAVLWGEMDAIPGAVALASPPLAVPAVIALIKGVQIRRRKSLGANRAAELASRRAAAVAAAQAKIADAKRELEKVFSITEAAIRPLENAQKRLDEAQATARETADALIKQCGENLAIASTRLHAAQERAYAAYEATQPQPTLPAGVNVENTWMDFGRIGELRGQGWGFGCKPPSGEIDRQTPVGVKGLVTV